MKSECRKSSVTFVIVYTAVDFTVDLNTNEKVQTVNMNKFLWVRDYTHWILERPLRLKNLFLWFYKEGNRGKEVKECAQDHTLGNNGAGILCQAIWPLLPTITDYSSHNWAVKEERGITLTWRVHISNHFQKRWNRVAGWNTSHHLLVSFCCLAPESCLQHRR